MADTFTIFMVAGTFLIAGTVKGITGFGLPTISIAILTIVFGLAEAIVFLLVPSLVTNIWQAFVGGYARIILSRLSPFFFITGCSVFIGVHFFSTVETPLLSVLLGVLLIIYGLTNLSYLRLSLDKDQEFYVGPIAGALNGIFTGLTGSMVVPGVMFLQAIGLTRDMLIQAMGMLFVVSTGALLLALQVNNLITLELGTMSAIGVVPAVAGMMLGQRVRVTLSEVAFRRIFFISNIFLGIYIVGTNQAFF